MNAGRDRALYTIADLDDAFQWIIDLSKDYSANSDVCNIRRDWELIKDGLLAQLNDGSYKFSLLDRYEYEDAVITLWSSQDMIVLKLITRALQHQTAGNIPEVLLSRQRPWKD